MSRLSVSRLSVSRLSVSRLSVSRLSVSRLSLPASLVLAAFTLAAALPASASTFAQDDASAYSTDFVGAGTNPNTVTQPNHGTGFNPFVFQSSAGNYAGWYLQTGNAAIGTGPNQNTFGIYASSDATTTGTRSFNFSPDGVTPTVPGATTPLLTGQTFSTSFQNRDIATGSAVGFSLENTAGAALFTFDFLGGTADYRVTDGAGTSTSTLPYTQGGLSTSFLLTGANAYTFTATNIDGTGTITQSGTFTGAIDRIAYFSNGSSGNGDVNFNNLSITGPAVPEASSSIGLGVMLALGGVGLLLKARKRRHAIQA
jgi:hypothetical protein